MTMLQITHLSIWSQSQKSIPISLISNDPIWCFEWPAELNSGYFIMWPNIGYKVAVFNNLVKFVQYLWCIFHICVMHVQYFVVYTPVFDILVWYTPMYPPHPNPESVPGMPADLIILVQTSLINKTIMLSKELQSSTRDLEIDTLSRDFITLSQLFNQKG